jgi:benzoyl-CoA-dihydrodiol lyase
MATAVAQPGLEAQGARVETQTHPARYRHWKLAVEGQVATLRLDVQESGGLRPGYELKLNSYDLGVDIELADAVNRLRFEHPEVGVVVVTSGKERVFCAGANIFMLRTSSHPFKVNFCKYTNETRLAMEEAADESGQVYLAALNGVTSGGGYELALACKEIHLLDDRTSAVSLPEVPFLGVLPGTGGLTRLVDKRFVRRDRADVFSTLAEGIKGQRAVEWRLVDAVHTPSQWEQAIAGRVAELSAAAADRAGRKGVALEPLRKERTDDAIEYAHVRLEVDRAKRTGTLTVRGPQAVPPLPADPAALGCGWYPLAVFRELDDALVELRFNFEEVGLLALRSEGDLERVLEIDAQLQQAQGHWFGREVLLQIRRTLKRLDLTARTLFTLVEPGGCFGGFLYELALASDRIYMLNDPGREHHIALSALNGGALPMGNGLGRLAQRFLAEPARAGALLKEVPARFTAAEAEQAGLVTAAPDDLDWDDEVRLAIEERASLSPDALTGMEASLRFAGPETMETKIFGRLSAWQNWIFQRPNATGERGALTLYGEPNSPEFDNRRT